MGHPSTDYRVSNLCHWTDRQAEAWQAAMDHRFILYGGARGGGKSYFLRWFCLLYCVAMAQRNGSITVGLFCNTYPELRDRQISKIKLEFPPWTGELKETTTGGLGYYLDEKLGGGMIALRNLDDPEKYRSAEFAAIADDEVTLHDLETFNYLRGSLRWPGITRPVYAGGTNPGGKGHGWVKNFWVDRIFPPEMRPLANEFRFVRSLPIDNPHLSTVYWDDLKTLPPNLARAWVEGDWSVFQGQAFSSWRYDLHVVKPFSLPDSWARWRAVDWGYSNPFCCLWLARNPDNGRMYVYREAYQRDLTDRQQARLIMDMTPPAERVVTTYADPSMWAAKSSGPAVTSTADEYLACGVMLTRADNDRLSGKRKLDRLLQNLPDGMPAVQVFETCTDLIRTLPSLAYDKVKVEDIDTNQEDHAYDALRYGLTQAREAQAEKKPIQASNSPFYRM